MPDPVLQLNNLETYYGPIAAIRGISLEVIAGQIITILGGNGAGKTTILKTISGIMVPQKGTVLFQGKSIHRQEPDRIARYGISHVPEGREMFPFLTVYKNLMLGAYFQKDSDQIHKDLEMTYGYFPILKERRDQQAGFLSGGEQQMLAIGRALMARPQLMLLDEPSLGLSPLLVQEIFKILVRLNQEQGLTILLVEQNANMALQIGHYGYVLDVGRIVMEDTCENLRQSKDIQEFYLGMKAQGVRGKHRWKRRKTWR